VAQNTVNGYLLRTTVIAPDGWTVSTADTSQAWYIVDGQGYLQIEVQSPLMLRLDVTPP